MTPYESHPLLAHLSITVLIVIAHLVSMVALLRKCHERRRHFVWFFVWDCVIITSLVNLCLIFPDPPGRQMVTSSAAILLVPLFWWSFGRRRSESKWNYRNRVD